MIILCGGAGNPVEYGIVTAMQGKSAASVNETGAGYTECAQDRLPTRLSGRRQLRFFRTRDLHEIIFTGVTDL